MDCVTGRSLPERQDEYASLCNTLYRCLNNLCAISRTIIQVLEGRRSKIVYTAMVHYSFATRAALMWYLALVDRKLGPRMLL
jgi:hypothetical protein